MRSTILSSSVSMFRSCFELYAAFSTFMMLMRSAINDVLPVQVRSFIVAKLLDFCKSKPKVETVSLIIDQTWTGRGYAENELYYAAQSYLPTKITQSYKTLKVGKVNESNNLEFAVDGRKEIVDEFEGTKFTWMLDNVENSEKASRRKDSNSFKLTFNKDDRDKAVTSYIPHVLKAYEAIKAQQRTIEIHSWEDGYWTESELSHPATFDTLALDPDMKKAIVGDLDRFLKRRETYKKLGKPWKRGYLFYGPPGTGKSSLIAAIANHLRFDVYDFQLSSIDSDSTLNRMMSATPKRSIIVIEDIDCNKVVNARSSGSGSDAEDSNSDAEDVQFTLSGLLNSMDGLWSSSGDEKIIIFTTNHKDKIDPALLRPGRMDMHINVSYIKPKAFRVLAFNFLGIQDHPLFEQIEELLEKVEVTPAVVAEQLIRNEDLDPDLALGELLKFLEEMEMMMLQKEEMSDDN